MSVEGRDVSRQGNVVRSNQSGVPSPSSPLDCPIGRMFPVSPTSGFPLFSYYKLHNFLFLVYYLSFTINFNEFVYVLFVENILLKYIKMVL